jgi:hypothetical protein
MYNSFAISGKVNRARMSAQAYNVQSVPLIIVDGSSVSNRILFARGDTTADRRTRREGARGAPEELSFRGRPHALSGVALSLR